MIHEFNFFSLELILSIWILFLPQQNQKCIVSDHSAAVAGAVLCNIRELSINGAAIAHLIVKERKEEHKNRRKLSGVGYGRLRSEMGEKCWV